MKKEEVRATVSGCIPSETVIRGTVAPCFEITVDFRTSKGMVQKSFKRGTSIDVGTTLNMCYDHRYDTVELSTNKATKINNVPIVLGCLLSAAILIGSIVIVSTHSGFSDKIVGCFIGLIMCLAFAWLGIFVGFIYPNKHRKLEDCILVEGRISGHIQTRHGLLWASRYSARYEYIYGGKICRVGSIVSQHKRKKIGTKVTIAVNEKTGEAFCVEENNQYFTIGMILIIVASLFIVMLIREFFIPE